MARLPNISKYCVVLRLLACASSKEYVMLTPSSGFCAMPLTTLGAETCAASKIVGTMSMTWWNWVRSSPFALIPLGQWTTIGLRVPPKWLATCLVH
jgi:hypothetical protein